MYLFSYLNYIIKIKIYDERTTTVLRPEVAV